MRRINKQHIPDITGSIRTCLIVKSLTGKIPQELKGPDTIINHTSINPSSVLLENEYTTSIRKEE